ncbi:uncharacterized protein LOC143557272 [Bidens hawaiensis]|uniref:uncharacterized protein LOC143557272 n=1 Tax=Bidens hawaiensis TaxID=980011 RepID=UPI00404B5D45
MASSRRHPGDFDGSYEINVITITDMTTRVAVKDSDTIGQIQRKIQGKKKFNRSALIMSIFIKNLEGRITYYLEVNPSDTIGNVKAKMGDFAHVLVFSGVALEDSSTLVDLNINDGSVLTRIDMAPHGKMEIFVHTFNKKTISLLVTPTDTIANVKLWIMYKEGVPVDEQVLIFDGMALRDSGTLSDFDIHGQSALTLVRRSRGSMKIFVKTFEGTVIPVKVNPSNTIGYVKSMIEGEVDIPHDEQELIFDETVLDNIDTVADCNINEESTLTLVRLSARYMNIFIMSQTGKNVTLKVKHTDTVYNVKLKFETIEGIPPDQMRFIYGGRQLMDDHTLADCHVDDESVIHSVLILRGD